MQSGGLLPKVIRVLDANDDPVTSGLTIASFTTSALGRGYGASVWSTYAAAFALGAHLGNGRWPVDFLLPPSAGHFDVEVLPVDPTLTVTPNRWQGEVETQDLDSLYGSIVKPVFMPTQGATLGQPYPGELVAYRWNSWTIPVKDQAGANIDLTTYNNFKLSVRSKDQVAIKLDATDGSPSGFVLIGGVGTLTIEWPESTGTIGTPADIYGWLPIGVLKTDPVYYEATADKDSNAAKTVPIIRSSELLITRREVGS